MLRSFFDARFVETTHHALGVWASLSVNPHDGAIRLLEQNLDNINWHCLSGNPNDGAIRLLEQNPDKINWIYLSGNPNDGAIRLLEQNPHNISWVRLSENPNDGAIRLLEQNPDKIDWTALATNQNKKEAIRLFEQHWHLAATNDLTGIHMCWENPFIFEDGYVLK